MPVCSRRRTMSASMRSPCSTGLRDGRALTRCSKRRGVDDESAAARAQRWTDRGGERRPTGKPARTKQTRCWLPHYPAIRGQNLRGFGWDIDTGQSTPRGRVFPIGSFGHTGFTGTSMWIDPGSDTYVVLLTNSIHTRGSPPASKLRGDVATAAAQALGLQ